MKSAAISPSQLTLNFEPGLVERYGSLRDCIATGVYQRGLKRVAIDLDQAPSNLSVQLSDDPSRRFSVDSLETYIEKTGDKTPVLYLVERFLAPELENKGVKQIEAMKAKLAELMQFIDQVVDAGLAELAEEAWGYHLAALHDAMSEEQWEQYQDRSAA